MHEMAIMNGMFQLINQQIAQHSLTKITKVKIVAGVASGAVPESLEMCFEVMSDRTICQDAQLEIEQTPLVAECSSCSNNYEVIKMELLCPKCGGKVKEFVSGKELYLDYIEGD